MSCIFSIIGEDFNPDFFIEKSGLAPYKITYKGTPRFKTDSDSEVIPYSFISITASNAGFDEFEMQIKDVINFLQENYHKLITIKDDSTIQYATLDFGVNYIKRFSNEFSFPKELVRLCGQLGLSIEISVYTNNH